MGNLAPMAFHLTVAGSLEPLADALATVLAEPLDDPFTPDDSTGWLYQPYRGLIKANVSAVDSAGKPIIDY